MAALPSNTTFCEYPGDMPSGFLSISPIDSIHYSKTDLWTILESPLKTAFSMKLA
jgi:hypothetical protein